MTKQSKLTAKQQEVVNLMADGWTLHWFQGMMIQGRCNEYCRLRNGNEDKKFPSNLPSLLKAKGIVEFANKSTIRREGIDYKLTKLGKSLARVMEEKGTEIWWFASVFSTEPTRKTYCGSTDSYLIREDGRKDAKMVAGYGCHYPSKEAAIEAIRNRLAQSIVNLRSSLDSAIEELERFNRKHKPTSP